MARIGRFSIDDVKTAYYKLKATVFYDSGDLLLREQIVEFETNKSKHPNNFISALLGYNKNYANYRKQENKDKKITIEEKFEIITEHLNSYHQASDFIDNLLKKVDVILYPKKFKQEIYKNNIISNKRIKSNYPLEKVTAFIKAPIELHILSVLWIMNEGVQKDAGLVDECMGNRLLLKKDKSKIVQGSALFKPYFTQYQKWRDGAVKTSKELLDNDKNVLFLNLDIKDYYYSVRINKDFFIPERIKNRNGLYNINLIMQKLHLDFTEKIMKLGIPNDFSKEVIVNNEVVKFILPIGLLSSSIIANDYLKEFDKVIIEKYKPSYYGRYVDDILLVLSDPNPQGIDSGFINKYNVSFDDYKSALMRDKKSTVSFGSFNKLNEIEKYVVRNFYPLINVVDSPFLKKEKNSCDDDSIYRIFKINNYESLYCQSEKTLIYFFDKDESSIVIDKLKKEIQEKSSEFRDMPNDEDNKIEFEESAYHLLYDGTEDKIRTLKDYKEDRFGLSVFLSHKINMTLRKQSKISEIELQKILKFFKGENCLTFYKLWEKILTLFVVNDSPIVFTDFLFHCLEQIDNISEPNRQKLSIGKDYSKYQNVRNTLVQYLFFAYEMAISLNLQFLDREIDIGRNYDFKSKEVKNKNFPLFFSNINFSKPNSIIGKRVRQSNMLRHHYVSIPLLSYTEGSKKGLINLIDKKSHIDNFKIDRELLENSPRPVKYWECCVASAFERFGEFRKNPANQTEIETNILYDISETIVENVFDEEKEEFVNVEKELRKNYLDIAFEFYLEGNSNHLASHILEDNSFKNSLYVLEELDRNDESFVLDEFTINKTDKLPNPKIAFANTDVLENNILDSILGSPNLSNDRYNKLSKILKKAREEETNLLLFPETFIPFNLISTLCRFAVDNQVLTISGLEHLTLDNTSFNYVVSIVPYYVNGVKDATVILRLKNNYSPNEEHTINKYHFAVPKPKPYRYEIINWRNIYFSVCYCFELANITHREKLKSKIDLLIGVEWNKDTPYFSNIVEATSRDLHCYVAQVNTSKYGDTRLTQPKETAIKDILRLKGGINDAILVGQINIEKLRDFQRIKSSINTSKEYKPLPPDFLLTDVLKRIKNMSLKTESKHIVTTKEIIIKTLN